MSTSGYAGLNEAYSDVPVGKHLFDAFHIRNGQK
jgi:hypothetical protein